MASDADELASERRRYSDERHDAIMAALGGVTARLDTLNGRTSKTEIDLAVMKDRQARTSALFASIMTALAAGMAYAINGLSRP